MSHFTIVEKDKKLGGNDVYTSELQSMKDPMQLESGGLCKKEKIMK